MITIIREPIYTAAQAVQILHKLATLACDRVSQSFWHFHLSRSRPHQTSLRSPEVPPADSIDSVLVLPLHPSPSLDSIVLSKSFNSMSTIPPCSQDSAVLVVTTFATDPVPAASPPAMNFLIALLLALPIVGTIGPLSFSSLLDRWNDIWSVRLKNTRSAGTDAQSNPTFASMSVQIHDGNISQGISYVV